MGSHCENYCSAEEMVIANKTKIFMGIKDKKHPSIKRFVNKASYHFGYMGNCLDHLQQFDKNSRESCLAGQCLQYIYLNSMEQQWRSLLNQKSFRQAGNLLNNLESLQTILEEH